MLTRYCDDHGVDRPGPMFCAVTDWKFAVKTLAIATVALLGAGCTEAAANCRDEVVAAYERLRMSSRPYRRETTIVVNDRQTYRQTAEYLPPDRLREVTDPGAVDVEMSEVIRVGARAWERFKRSSWQEWESGVAQEIFGGSAGMDFSVWPDRVVPVGLDFECLGRVVFKDTAYVGYRAKLPKVIYSITNAQPSEQEKQELMARFQQMPQTWRTVFLDLVSALPVLDMKAEENQLDNPKSKIHFTYPTDIKIDPPVP
jgi:hypothetical protein